MAERKTLDFVILAGLLRESRSGYDLSGWLAEETSHFFSIGHSSIYPALARLDRDGLVRHEVLPSAKGPARKVYSLTEAGRESVLRWAEEPAAAREVRDELLVKALCYGFLPEDRAVERLQKEKAGHARKLEIYQSFARALEAQLAAGAISREAYLGTLLTIKRGIGAEKSYAEWCDEAITMMSSSAASPDARGSKPAQG